MAAEPMTEVEREVSATREAFLHGVRLAFPNSMIETERGARVCRQNAVMEIAIAPCPDRRLGLVRLPQIRVHIRFVAGSLEDQQTMLVQMDAAMQRGGG